MVDFTNKKREDGLEDPHFLRMKHPETLMPREVTEMPKRNIHDIQIQQREKIQQRQQEQATTIEQILGEGDVDRFIAIMRTRIKPLVAQSKSSGNTPDLNMELKNIETHIDAPDVIQKCHTFLGQVEYAEQEVTY